MRRSQELFIALVDIGMISRMATPSINNKWSGYVHKMSSIIFGRHGDAYRIICVNNPYEAAHSSKDDERDLSVQGKGICLNTYMKLAEPYLAVKTSKTLLCSISKK